MIKLFGGEKVQKKLLITTLMILFSLILCGSASAANYNTDTDLTLSHNSSVPGDQINCTARVTYRVPGTDPAVPDGLQVQFWTRTTGGGGGPWSNFANGTINSTGYASAIYTVTSSSDREMEARFYQQSTGGNTYRYSDDSDDLDIDPTTTSLTVNPTTTDVGSPVTLRSRLTVGGNGWNGQTIHFFVDGVEIGAANTDWYYSNGWQSGWANLIYTPTTSGTQNVQAFFYGRLEGDWGDCDYQYYMGNNSSQTLNVRGADLEVTKTVNNTTPNYLDNVVFTVTVTNNGPYTAVNTRVSDLLPAGLSLISATPSTGAYNNVTGLWTVGDLVNGASATLQLVAQVLGHNTTLTNLANGSSNTFDRNLTNNNDSATVTVHPAADIVVTKDVNNTAPNYQDNVTFTVIVRNDGPDDATGVSLSDFLPAGLIWVSDDSSGTYDPVTGLWTIGNLANNTFVTLHIVAQVLGHNAIIDNVANASAIEFDPNLTNNRANVTISVPASADIAVTKTVNNATPDYLGNVVFTVTVTNNGPDDATGVSLSDLLPTGLNWISDDSSGTYDHVTGIWTIGNLNNGSMVTLNIVALVNQTGIITNVANGSSDLYDWNLTNNAANATVTTPQTSELVLSKTVDKTKVTVGETVRYLITVINNGPDAALNTMVTDNLPSGMQYLSSIASTGSYDPSTGLWTIGTMANGATETLEIFVKVLATGTYTNFATVSSSSSNPGTNSSDVVIEVIGDASGGGDETDGSVSMQDTGIPINLLVIALLTIVAGMVLPKGKINSGFLTLFFYFF